jgi:hypothetical protein
VLFPTSASKAYYYVSGSGYGTEDVLATGKGYWLKYNVLSGKTVIGEPITSDTIEVKDRWNLIGAIGEPVSVDSIGSNPPGMIVAGFYRYTGSGYELADVLFPGTAYWVKVGGDGQLYVTTSGNITSRIRIVPTSEMPPPPPVVSEQVEVPKEFAVSQNYPNPFNPSTVIHYALPKDVYVTLIVYDVLGREVVRLVEGKQAAGFYDVKLSGESLASGVYVYRLKTDDNVAVRKMLLMR